MTLRLDANTRYTVQIQCKTCSFRARGRSTPIWKSFDDSPPVGNSSTILQLLPISWIKTFDTSHRKEKPAQTNGSCHEYEWFQLYTYCTGTSMYVCLSVNIHTCIYINMYTTHLPAPKPPAGVCPWFDTSRNKESTGSPNPSDMSQDLYID